MGSKKLFDKYYSRLAREAMLKAFIIGFIAGFAVNIVIAFVTLFFTDFKLWFVVALGAGIIVTAITALLLYFKAFKPTTKKIASRIDSLGLEERLITMTELENDESYIAMRQREDAKAKLNEVNSKSIKFVIARSLIVAVAIFGVVGLAMTSINALTGFGIIDWSKIFPQRLSPSDYVTVTYLISGKGEIEGETLQRNIVKGNSATPVVAVAADGWAFVGWTDNVNLPERNDANLQTDLTVTAVFEEVEDIKDKNDEQQEDAPSDVPGDGDEKQDNAQGQEGPGGGSRYEPANTIIDGKIPYEDDFDDWFEAAMEELYEDGNLTDEQRAVLEAYYKSLQSGVRDKQSNNDDNLNQY